MRAIHRCPAEALDTIPGLLRKLDSCFEQLRSENERLRSCATGAPGGVQTCISLAGCTSGQHGGLGTELQSTIRPDAVTADCGLEVGDLAELPRMTKEPRFGLSPVPKQPACPAEAAALHSDCAMEDDVLGTALELRVAQVSHELQGGGLASPAPKSPESSKLRPVLRADSDGNADDTIELLSRWDPSVKHNHIVATPTRFPSSATVATRTGDVLASSGLASRFVLHPTSTTRIFWDVMSLVVIGFDVLLTPLSVFGFHYADYYPNLSWLICIFWTLDMALQCITGYDAKGLIEMRPAFIVRKYLRGWFRIDLVIMIIDWTLTGTGSVATRMLRITKTVRMLRLLRMVRLIRLFKLAKVLYTLDALLQSLCLQLTMRIGKNICAIVIVNHFIACGWFAISREGGGEMESWVDHLPAEVEGGEPSTLYFYTTSLHWALTQFTPASMEVHARNPVERVFTIFVLLVSIIMFSSLVASTTAAMTQLTEANAERVKQGELLRRFITEHRVSVDLGNRIVTQVAREQKRLEARPVLESQVPALSRLPNNLRKQLHVEVYSNMLFQHPFFEELAGIDNLVVEKLCHKAMAEIVYGAEDLVWQCGQTAGNMFFVQRGKLIVSANDSTRSKDFRTVTTAYEAGNDVSDDGVACAVGAGACISEHALWLHWSYRSDARTCRESELFVLNAAEFAAAVKSPAASHFCAIYARNFERHVKGAVMPGDVSIERSELEKMLTRSFAELHGDVGRSLSLNSGGRLRRTRKAKPSLTGLVSEAIEQANPLRSGSVSPRRPRSPEQRDFV